MKKKRKVPVFEAQYVLLQLFHFLKNVDHYELSSNVQIKEKYLQKWKAFVLGVYLFVYRNEIID